MPKTCRARSLLKGLRLRSNRRAAGAPLTVILPGKRMPGTEDGSRPEFAWRGAERSVTAGRHWPHGSGEDRPASAARTRQRPRAREAARQPTPQERAVPRLPAAVGLVALPVSVRAPLSATSRLSAPEPGQAPALACRRRALEKTRKESCHTPSAHSGRGRGPGARRVRKLADGEFSPSIDVSLLPQASMQIRTVSEQAFNIFPLSRFMIAHKHHSLSSKVILVRMVTQYRAGRLTRRPNL